MSELCSGAPPFQKAQGDSNFEINPAFPYFPSYVPGALKDLALRCKCVGHSMWESFKCAEQKGKDALT
eukprot:1139974-Pelagomonas_calceolata.AAC.2